MRLRGVMLTGALVALAVPALPAQQVATADVAVSAAVMVTLTTTALRHLQFGTTPPGTNVTIAPTSTSSAWFQVPNIKNGQQREALVVTYTTLPSVLTSTSGNGATLPIVWTNGGRACLQKSGTEYFCYPVWTPAQGVGQQLLVNGPGSPNTPGGPGTRTMNIYLGGTIQPAIGQRGGSYIGTVTISLTYLNL